MVRRSIFALGLTLSTLLAACGPAEAPQESQSLSFTPVVALDGDVIAKTLFGAERSPSRGPAQSFGGYAKGCQAGARPLPESGPTWQAMRLSRNRNWGQPELVDYLQDLSRYAATLPGWAGLYVGDMSQPKGGPMLTGHRSHQSGLDADIWMLPPQRLNLTAAERESLSSISTRRASGAYTNGNWTPQHEALLEKAARDTRVARIFVFPGAKVALCDGATAGDTEWLRKIRPWWGHHYHFHVRLRCPRGDSACENQAPPPPGNGCAEAKGWVDRILNPPPPDPNAPPAKPRRDLRLRDLPSQCQALIAQ